jgi:glycosyltransferase involved in cell wall biosynthesis
MARFLTDAGFNVFVLCYGDESKIEQLEGITIKRFHFPTKVRNTLYALIEIIPAFKMIWALQIKKFVRDYQIEVLQVHDLYMLGPALLANKKVALPIVANFHENFVAAIKTYSWTHSFLGKQILKLSSWEEKESDYLKSIDRLIVLSEGFKESLLKKYSFLKASDIITYPNVVDIDEFQGYAVEKIPYKKNGNLVLCYFGVIAARRGIFTLLEAFNQLKDLKIQLLLIGPLDKNEKAKYLEYFQKLKGRVYHIPWIDIDLLPSYLSFTDIALSPILKNPQHDSGVANKIFQYMLFGKPIIASDSTEQKRVIEENNCGLIHKSDDPKDLADKIQTLYRDVSLRSILGENGKKAVFAQYNTEVQSKKTIKMYRELETEVNSKVI